MSGLGDPGAIRVLTAAALPLQCPACWGQRAIWEPGALGLVPVVCAHCAGTGELPASGDAGL